MIKEAQILIPLLKTLRLQILDIYNSDFSHTLKEDSSPVTEADLFVHEKIISFIKKKFPQDNIISEESTSIVKNKSGNIWVIDPIDGTKEFVNKTGEFSIMIGLLSNGVPEFGLVYLPIKDISYFAKKGEGSYKLEENSLTKLRVNIKEKNITLVRSRNNFKEQDQTIVDVLNIEKFVTLGSIGIKFSSIAENKANLCFYSTPGLGIWDALPSQVILEEAGGYIFDRNGGTLRYDLDKRIILEGVVGCSCLEIKKKFLDAYSTIK